MLAPWCGGEGGAALERCGRAKAGILRRFMSVKQGRPSPEAVAALFTALEPDRLQQGRRRLKDWAAGLAGAVRALDGTSRRRSCAAAAARAGASGAGRRRRPPGARPGAGR